ncbi:MAG TPA: helix-hairpin-helix domain-containing protein [Longimicrobiales bacterium]
MRAPRLTNDEARALGFVALLLTLAAVARVAARGPAFAPEVATIDRAELERAAAAAADEEARRREPLAPGERLDVNTAPAAALDRLPGVGRALAARIVAERERGGPFRSLADLTRVSGIGERSLARLAPHLSVDDGAAAAAGAHRPRSVLFRPDAADTPSVEERREGEESGRRVDLNRASAAELEQLPGIGPVLAARIVAYRDSAGPFHTLDELVHVSGIGPASLARLRPHLRLGTSARVP